MAQQQHIVTSFEDELQGLARSIAEMGGRAEQLVERSIHGAAALDPRSRARGASRPTRRSTSCSGRSRNAPSSSSPAASRWRRTCARRSRAIRIASDLERIGDLGKNIASRGARHRRARPSRNNVRIGVEHLAELGARGRSRRCSTPTPRATSPRRSEVCARDDEIDAVYNSLFRQLLTYMMEDPRNISMCTHLLFCAKNIERIGDHATNIAETVLLPDHRPAMGRAAPVEHARRGLEEQAAMAKPLILIVEDEEPLTLLLRYNLEAEGYEVETVARGDEAEMRLRERVPDLLVLDWMLPGLSGIELCRRLRARDETARAADPDADGARRGGRAHPRPCHRRRRLCRKAVLGAGADGAREGAAAPRPPGARSRRC